jgi:hypothetical protein
LFTKKTKIGLATEIARGMKHLADARVKKIVYNYCVVLRSGSDNVNLEKCFIKMFYKMSFSHQDNFNISNITKFVILFVLRLFTGIWRQEIFF